MIAERIEWEFASAPIREQLRLRSARAGDAPIKLYPFEREMLDKRPPENDAVDDALQALDDLASCRSIGMDLGRIPITAIWQWCDRRGLDREAAAIMTEVLLRADKAYLAGRAKKASKT